MLSAFLWWLSQGQQRLALPVSRTRFIVLELPPISFASPVSVAHVGSAPSDEDDPDIEDGELDDESHESGELSP
jgi:hypothetical protein